MTLLQQPNFERSSTSIGPASLPWIAVLRPLLGFTLSFLLCTYNHISRPTKMSDTRVDSSEVAASSSSGKINEDKGKQPEVMDTMFVGWVPGSPNEPRKTAPRLHHKKSRTGCQQCRARRVKVRSFAHSVSLSFSGNFRAFNCFLFLGSSSRTADSALVHENSY